MNLSNIRSTAVRNTAQYYASPASIKQLSLDYLEAAAEGQIDIPDPSSPFMFLLEASATQASTACLKSESVAMERYPRLAQNYSHLYHHMADADFLDRFATPARTTFTLIIPTRTIKEYAIRDSETGVDRIIIPKETQFTVAGMDWYLHYPIVIEISPNGIVHVRYDLNSHSPLYDATNNLLNYNLVNNLSREELVINIPVEQLSMDSLTNPVSPSNGFSGVFPFEDQFYFARAYHRSGGEWQEMTVTHSDMVYDIDRPTLVVKVNEQALEAYVPDVYMTQRAIGDQLRLDIFTTRGLVTLDLMDHASEDFSAVWRDLDVNPRPETAAMASMNNLSIFAGEPVTTGRDGLTFEELRERVIYRSADNRASISFSELSYQLKDRGYSLSRAKDTVMERLYVCAKTIPAPADSAITTPIGVRHAYVTLDGQDTNYGDVVKSNFGRLTLTPNALFKEQHGSAMPIADVDRRAINEMSLEERVVLLNQGEYFFTPFFYVLDNDAGLYTARTYYLDACQRTSQSFVGANEALPYAVNTKGVEIVREENRFIVRIEADHPNGLEGVRCQLTFVDGNERRYTLLGEQVPIDSQTSAFEFTLISNLDVTPDDLLGFRNFIGESGTPELVYTELVDTFHILYSRESTTPVPTPFDDMLMRDGTSGVVGVTHETCRIRWGYSLPMLFSRTRATLVPPVYQRHLADVPQRYEYNVPRRNAEGKIVWAPDPETGKPVIDYIHREGELVIVDGEQQYEARAGDVVVENGEPVTLEDERLVWEIAPILLDGRYRYATTADAINYRDSIGETIQGFLTHDLANIVPSLMERTELHYQPTASVGTTMVTVDGKQDIAMDTALSFQVTYMLTPAAYKDISLRKQLVRFTQSTLSTVVNDRILSISRIIEALMAGSDDIINVSISNPIGGHDVARIMGDNMHFSIRPELTILTNGEVDVVDSIDVSFVQERVTTY